MSRPPRPFSAARFALFPFVPIVLLLGIGHPVQAAVAPRPDPGLTAVHAAHSVRAAARGTTFYVDPAGSDAASGTSPRTAWASLARVSAARLRPGDRVLLRRGGSWSGALRVTASGTALAPIRIGSYGVGALPRVTGACVEVRGDQVVVEEIAAVSCSWWGFHVLGDHVTVRSAYASGNVAGVSIDRGADDARVLGNRLVDNNRLAPGTGGPDDDYGANGIEVLGSRAEIAGNVISGSWAPSPDYGTDGSAIEVYEAVGTRVHDNTAVDDLTFTELGSALTADTRYEHNVVRSRVPGASFLITRGPGDPWGPVFGTVVAGNDVRLTGAGSFLVWCGGECGPEVLAMGDNQLSLG